MPTLRAADLERLQRVAITVCPKCERALRPNYCRQHDEFFEAGHMSAECTGRELHDSHRTY